MPILTNASLSLQACQAVLPSPPLASSTSSILQVCIYTASFLSSLPPSLPPSLTSYSSLLFQARNASSRRTTTRATAAAAASPPATTRGWRASTSTCPSTTSSRSSSPYRTKVRLPPSLPPSLTLTMPPLLRTLIHSSSAIFSPPLPSLPPSLPLILSPPLYSPQTKGRRRGRPGPAGSRARVFLLLLHRRPLLLLLLLLVLPHPLPEQRHDLHPPRLPRGQLSDRLRRHTQHGKEASLPPSLPSSLPLRKWTTWNNLFPSADYLKAYLLRQPLPPSIPPSLPPSLPRNSITWKSPCPPVGSRNVAPSSPWTCWPTRRLTRTS